MEIRTVMVARVCGSAGRLKATLSQQCLPVPLHAESCDRNQAGAWEQLKGAEDLNL
jgi:hypothetical protein